MILNCIHLIVLVYYSCNLGKFKYYKVFIWYSYIFVLQDGYWVGGHVNRSQLVLFPCPQPHCICKRFNSLSCNVVFDPDDTNSVCYNNRTGKLTFSDFFDFKSEQINLVIINSLHVFVLLNTLSPLIHLPYKVFCVGGVTMTVNMGWEC